MELQKLSQRDEKHERGVNRYGDKNEEVWHFSLEFWKKRLEIMWLKQFARPA